MIATSIGKAIFQSRGWRPVFLLRDDFLVDAAAPLASPRTADPGPGTLVITDGNNKLSVASGKLVFATGGVGVGNPGLWGSLQTRVAGKALLATILSIGTALEVGWDSDQTSSIIDGLRVVNGTNQLRSNGSLVDVGITIGALTYQVAIVQRAVGFLAFIKGGIYTSWTLVWIGNAGSANQYPALSAATSTTTPSVDTVRVVDLPSPFSDDYGLVTRRLAGARALNDVYTHEANCIIEWTCTTLPSSGNNSVRFRQQDSNNFWSVYMDSTGAFGLSEVVAGSGTVRANAAAVLANGHRCLVVADGTTIKGFSNNTLRWTYASASNFVTNTDGLLGSLGTAGAVSDIVAWPRVPRTEIASLLDMAMAA